MYQNCALNPMFTASRGSLPRHMHAAASQWLSHCVDIDSFESAHRVAALRHVETPPEKNMHRNIPRLLRPHLTIDMNSLA